MESNDSPEIPDRGGDIRHPRPPLGGREREFPMKDEHLYTAYNIYSPDSLLLVRRTRDR